MNLLKPLASLKLTVFCLILGLILVFGGTLAQVHLGLYEVQARYFRSWIVFWSPEGASWRIPVFPGGWLIGGVLVVNLVAALFVRFQFTLKKAGLLLAHLGLIFLLVGQFATEAFQRESLMRIEVGQTLNYSEDSLKNELVLIDTSPKDHDDVIAIPESTLLKGDVTNPRLPFKVKVLGYYANSTPTLLSAPDAASALRTTNGAGTRLCFTKASTSSSLSQDNNPAVLIELVSEQGSLGSWLLSTWLSKPRHVEEVRQWLNDNDGFIAQPQSFTFSNRVYQLALRPVRYYTPYSLKLLEFHHDLYPGTQIPKNFSSRVHLSDSSNGENRDVLIYMNNPLRYHGDTYYQSSFEPGDKVSILQVVRNPASATPYISCTMISVGLLFQFLVHLVGFMKRKPESKL